MRKDYISLDDFRVSYDENTGSIALTCADRKLKNQDFKITLSANSGSYWSLFKLLEQRDLVKAIELPSVLHSDSANDFLLPLQDERLYFTLGEIPGGSPFTFDLEKAPHTLISGGAGSGKSVLSRTIANHAYAQESIELWFIDPERLSLKLFPADAHTKRAVNLSESCELLEDLEKELEHRLLLLKQQKLSKFSESGLPAIYLIIEEFRYFSLSGIKNEEGRRNDVLVARFHKTLEDISEKAAQAGIFIFVNSQRPDATLLKATFKEKLPRRILMGRADTTTNAMMFHGTPRFASNFLTTRGRGICQVDGKQQIFQAYFTPWDRPVDPLK